MLKYIELNMNKYFIGKIIIFNIFEFILFTFLIITELSIQFNLFLVFYIFLK